MNTQDILYILDLDRTLIDVKKVMEVVKEACLALDINFSEIYEEQMNLEKRGSAYSPFNFLQNHSDVAIEDFMQVFLKLSHRSPIIFDDTREFIDLLEREKRPYMILTYGIDREWQLLKLKASGLAEVPTEIVDSKDKSGFIISKIKKGRFSPGLKGLGEYSACVFIDDRESSFQGFPEGYKGYLLKRSMTDNPADFPDNVHLVRTLSDIPVN